MSDIGFSDEFDFEDAGFSDYDSASATNADNDDEAQLENLYFSAKSLRDDDASAAIAHFQKVVDICGSKNELEWYEYIFTINASFLVDDNHNYSLF